MGEGGRWVWEKVGGGCRRRWEVGVGEDGRWV